MRLVEDTGFSFKSSSKMLKIYDTAGGHSERPFRARQQVFPPEGPPLKILLSSYKL